MWEYVYNPTTGKYEWKDTADTTGYFGAPSAGGPAAVPAAPKGGKAFLPVVGKGGRSGGGGGSAAGQPQRRAGAFKGIPLVAVGQDNLAGARAANGYGAPEGDGYGAPSANITGAYEGVDTDLTSEDWEFMWGAGGKNRRNWGATWENRERAQSGDFHGLNAYGQPLGTHAPYRGGGKAGNKNAHGRAATPEEIEWIKSQPGGVWRSGVRPETWKPKGGPGRTGPARTGGTVPGSGGNGNGNGNGGNNNSQANQYFYPNDLINWSI